MRQIPFWKMNGSGNDFVLVDNRDGLIAEGEMGAFVAGVCRRRHSVGADGVIFVIRSRECDFGWRFFNADGGEVAMCGNGSRCVARFALLKGIAASPMCFETLAGPVHAEVSGRTVKVRMPRPSQPRCDLPMALPDGCETLDSIDTGVPHVAASVLSLDAHPVLLQGRELRYHAAFQPGGTNANFYRVLGPNRIAVRTYERGVEDETLACGTGSIACALLASLRGWVSSPVEVLTRGGEVLVIHFRKGTNGKEPFEEVWLQGETSISCEGSLHEEAF